VIVGQAHSENTDTPATAATTVALDQLAKGGLAGNGVHWTLEESEDLNVNLVHLDADAEVSSHKNTEVDVLIVGLAGTGRLVVDGLVEALEVHTLAHVPKGSERSMHAGDSGLTYLTVHRRRGPLSIATRPAQ
jgi:quercetin dioxygenase-like cupin family protein